MTAHLYFYPRKGGGLVDLDLGRGATNLVRQPVVNDVVNDAMSGYRAITRYGAWNQVTITVELSRFASGGSLLADNLEVLWRHLLRGGTVAFAEEDDCLWGGYVTGGGNVVTNRNYVRIEENLWKKWPGTVSTTTGDRITLRSPSPDSLEEEMVVDTRSGREITFTARTRLNYDDQPWVFARDSRFWPYLRLQQGARSRQLWDEGRRILGTLVLPLEESLPKLGKGDNAWDIADEGVFDYEKIPGMDPEDFGPPLL